MSSARPLRVQQPRSRLRVVKGRGHRRATIAPFVMFGAVVVASMIGLVVARTSLDAGAFELTALNDAIELEERLQERLQLDVARLESPGRIAPMAENMGMVIPEERLVLLIEDPSEQKNDDIAQLAMSSNTLEAGG